MNQEFHPSNIISKYYNYVVDYFELRAQPGLSLTIPAQLFWDGILGTIYPKSISDNVVIGGTTTIGDEALRVVGKINATQLIINDSYIKRVGDDLTFYDPAIGEITLSELYTGIWTGTSGVIYPTTLTNNVLMGLDANQGNIRLQVVSESLTGYIFKGYDNLLSDVFSIDNYGNVILSGSISFGSEVLSINSGFQFYYSGGNRLLIDELGLHGTSWDINEVNPFFSNKFSTGFGLPTNTQAAVYISGVPTYFFGTSFDIPQETWITSNGNLLRRNSSGDIELGLYTFGTNILSFDTNTSFSIDGSNNLVFTDIYGSFTLSQLANISETFWKEDSGNIQPKLDGYEVVIPILAKSENKSVFVDSSGKLFSGDIIQRWNRNVAFGILTPAYDDYIILGKDDYATYPTYKFEIWDSGNLLFGVGSSEIIANKDIIINAVINFTDTNTQIWEDGSSNLTFKDTVAGTKTLAELVTNISYWSKLGTNISPAITYDNLFMPAGSIIYIRDYDTTWNGITSSTSGRLNFYANGNEAFTLISNTTFAINSLSDRKSVV